MSHRDRKSDRSRRRSQENNDEDRRERERTPRRYDSSSYSDWNWMDAEPRGYWWRSKTNEWDEVIYEYDTETQAPETESIASSSRNYTTDRKEDSIASHTHWQRKSTQSDVASRNEDLSYDLESSGYFAESGSGPSWTAPTKGSSSKESFPLTKMSPATMSQNLYVGRTVTNDDDNDSLADSHDSLAEGNQQMSIHISGSEPTNQSPQLPPVLIPPSIICGCESGDHLCGVVIYPSQPSPRDGKISSKKSKGKAESSSGSGSGSGSGKLSARVRFFPRKCLSSHIYLTDLRFFIQGPNGSGCGPIVMPGVTPFPRPQPPSEGSSSKHWNAYQKQITEWEEGYRDWKHITCPCRRGYFDEDGKWVSGGDVRKGVMNSNPRWESNNGFAPDVKANKDRYKVRLFSRVEDS
ncbi:hypothetical protein BKA65DRAFT_68563 [Rhexocercosporidium sp. MPI-PUGE-AT-0058]|nr:hypothetical protein BKA65DRAFT_68563 [Rhexocercosporidium sp. MPI-PUGE-AT-0058]